MIRHKAVQIVEPGAEPGATEPGARASKVERWNGEGGPRGRLVGVYRRLAGVISGCFGWFPAGRTGLAFVQAPVARCRGMHCTPRRAIPPPASPIAATATSPGDTAAPSPQASAALPAPAADDGASCCGTSRPARPGAGGQSFESRTVKEARVVASLVCIVG
jgi:hypothetical protein